MTSRPKPINHRAVAVLTSYRAPPILKPKARGSQKHRPAFLRPNRQMQPDHEATPMTDRKKTARTARPRRLRFSSFQSRCQTAKTKNPAGPNRP